MPENEQSEQQPDVRLVKLSEIKVDDTNVRHTDKDKDLDLLKSSIRQHGLLQPVVVMRRAGTPSYRLIIGQRRFRAHKQLGRDRILALIVPQGSDEEARVLSLVENLQRVEPDYADVATAVTFLYDKLKDPREVARKLNLPQRTVNDYLRIELFATPKVKELIRKDPSLKADARRALKAAQYDKKEAEELLLKLRKMTWHEKRRLSEYSAEHPRASADRKVAEARKPRIQETIVLSLDEELRSALGEAQGELLTDWVDTAGTALREWLRDKGFLKTQ